MIRVIRLCVVLIGSFAAFLVTLRLVGASQPDPIAVLFTNPDGTPCKMPCLLGVRPEDMTVGEALQILRAHPLVGDMRFRYVGEQNVVYGMGLIADGAEITMRLRGRYTGDSSPIGSISLVRYSTEKGPYGALPKLGPELMSVMDSATLGRFLVDFGLPEHTDRIGVAFDNDALLTRYQGKALLIFSRLKLDSYSGRWVIDIDGGFEGLSVVMPDQNPRPDTNRWFGFIPIDAHYTKSGVSR
jgi:hypothetical protein